MKASTTISINKPLLERARSKAKAEKRSFSAQLEQWLEERFAEMDAVTPRKAKGAAK